MLVPETSPLMCLACQSVFPPDPPTGATGNTKLGYICPLCEGPLQMVLPSVQPTVMAMPDGTYASMEDIQKMMQERGIPAMQGGEQLDHNIGQFGPDLGGGE